MNNKKVRKILYDPKLNGNRKIEETKNILYYPKNKFFKPEEDHYKPVRIDNAFDSNYIEYKNKGNKDKNLSVKKYLDMIRPYLTYIKNDHKIQGSTRIKHKTRVEWKIS